MSNDSKRISIDGGYSDSTYVVPNNKHKVWNDSLIHACISGNIKLAKDSLLDGAYMIDSGMIIACEKGKFKMAELMTQKGATDWNHGLYKACSRGYIELAKLMISYLLILPPSPTKTQTEWWNKTLISLWNNGLDSACRGGYVDIVNLMISTGANNLCRGFYIACEAGNYEIIRLLVPLILTKSNEPASRLLDINKICKMSDTDHDNELDSMFGGDCIDWDGIITYEIDWDEALKSAVWGKCPKTIEFITNHIDREGVELVD